MILIKTRFILVSETIRFNGEIDMNPNRLAVVSIVLSIIAISLSAITLVYLINPFQLSQGKPSFFVVGVDTFYTFTRIYLVNNGTATANNVKISLILGEAMYQNEWFIARLLPNRHVTLGIPMGRQQFEHATLYVHIECDELLTATSFQFDL